LRHHHHLCHHGIGHIASKCSSTHGVHAHSTIPCHLRLRHHHVPAKTAAHAPTPAATAPLHHRSTPATAAPGKAWPASSETRPTSAGKAGIHLAYAALTHLAHAAAVLLLLDEAAAPAAVLGKHAELARGCPGHHHITPIQLLPVTNRRKHSKDNATRNTTISINHSYPCVPQVETLPPEAPKPWPAQTVSCSNHRQSP
jgi:hypothetical protein